MLGKRGLSGGYVRLRRMQLVLVVLNVNSGQDGCRDKQAREPFVLSGTTYRGACFDAVARIYTFG